MVDESVLQLIGAFITIFSVLGFGFAIQRLQPLGEQTLTDLSNLVVKILLPIYLFYATAVNTNLHTFNEALLLVVLGAVATLGYFLLATLFIKPFRVAEGQRPVFRFSMMYTNTALLAMPICGILFGPLGVVYAMLYAFGNDLVNLTLGVWELRGGRFSNLRSLYMNPLIWGLLGGLLWSWMQLPFPEVFRGPFELVGPAAVPLALIIGGAKIASIRSREVNWRKQVLGFNMLRLIIAPLFIAMILFVLGWSNQIADIVIIQAAMPVGVTAAIMAKAYEADAEFAASLTLWSTVASVFTAPLIIFIFVSWL
jgi:predicted permease